MNERIRELALQAGINFYKKPVLNKDYPELYNGVYCESELGHQQKFAELIVRECAEIAYKTYWDNPETVKGIHIKEAIREYFGVEE